MTAKSETGRAAALYGHGRCALVSGRPLGDGRVGAGDRLLLLEATGSNRPIPDIEAASLAAPKQPVASKQGVRPCTLEPTAELHARDP